MTDGEKLCYVSPRWFVEYYKIKNEQGTPLEFKQRKFLVNILEDKSPLQAILKAPQIGMTVLQLVKSLWWAFYNQKDIIYTLPTESDVQEMAGGKINRIIAQNPIFLDWIKEHDTVSQKNVGKNIIYYRGTFTAKAAMMVTSQINIHDEIDASKPEVITQYETRQQAQPGGMRWYFSHPSMVGAGIDNYWQKSDQKEWFVQCSGCKEIQFLEWPESIDQQRVCYQCKFCGTEITDLERANGYDGIDSWRKKYPEAEYSGYHISQLICPWIPAAKIIKDFKEKDAQYFYNYVLALPYADAKSKVTLETIKNSLTDTQERKGRVIFGVDTGLKIRWVCGDMNGLIDMGEVESYEDLQREVNRYQDWIMVIDQGGDIIGARQFAENNAGKVFLCYFQQDKKQLTLIKWGTDDEYGMVRVDRNRLIQLVVDEFNDGRIPLQGSLEKWWNLWLHWQFMYRVVGEDKMGNFMYVWECDKSAHRNDWCFIAGTKIKTSMGDRNIENIKSGEMVWTRQGLRKVLHSGITNEAAETYTATFSNGSTLTATGNHPVYTHNRGFVALDALSYCDTIDEWNPKLFYSKEKSTDAILNPSADNYESISTKLVGDSRHYIRRFGSRLMEKYQKVLQYIIEIKTLLITQLVIWNYYLAPNTNLITIGKYYSTLADANKIRRISNTSAKLGSKLWWHFLRRKQESNYFMTTQSKHLNSQKLKASNALFAASKLKQNGSKEENIAQEGVRLEIKPESTANDIQTIGRSTTLVSIQKNQQRKTVYNLFVDDTHEYYANDILVHNCLAQCYWRVGIDRFAQNESLFVAPKADNDIIPSAPYRTNDMMVGEAIKITMPEVPSKEDNWLLR